jgi:hypothetical protein
MPHPAALMHRSLSIPDKGGNIGERRRNEKSCEKVSKIYKIEYI